MPPFTKFYPCPYCGEIRDCHGCVSAKCLSEYWADQSQKAYDLHLVLKKRSEELANEASKQINHIADTSK